jgi:hypothetical protein
LASVWMKWTRAGSRLIRPWRRKVPFNIWTMDVTSLGWIVPWMRRPLDDTSELSCAPICWTIHPLCLNMLVKMFTDFPGTFYTLFPNRQKHLFKFFKIPWQVEMYSTGWKCLPYFGLILAFRGRERSIYMQVEMERSGVEFFSSIV